MPPQAQASMVTMNLAQQVDDVARKVGTMQVES